MGGPLVKPHSSHRSSTGLISLQLRIDGQIGGLPQQRPGPQREPTAQPVTQLRRNGSCCPGGVGARQATQPSHRSLSLWSGKNNRRQAAVCIGVTPRCVLYTPVRRGTKEGVILQLPAMPPGFPLTLGCVHSSLVRQGGTSTQALPYLHMPPPLVCTMLSKFFYVPQPKY